jgi:hypothetical protein
MWKIFDNIPMSRANLAICVTLAVGLVICLALGLWTQAVMLSLMLAFGIGCIALARRPEASDLARVNAIEYKDERDVRIARDGFVVVGVIALILSLVGYVAAIIILPNELNWIALTQLLVLYGTWGVANSIAARKH